MFDVVYFSSVSENTKRFVDKLGIPNFRIPLSLNEASAFTHDESVAAGVEGPRSLRRLFIARGQRTRLTETRQAGRAGASLRTADDEHIRITELHQPQADADGMRYLGFLMAALMMVFILMYGMMVFRSVLEEKQSRIVEVILTSVRPVKLLIGKISGIALLGLLQFICMGLLTWLLSMGLRQTYLSQSIKLYEVYKSQQATVFKNGAESDFSKLSRFDENLELFDLFKKAETLAFDHVFWVFVAFFLAGFLFYSAFMAAMASAADTEADAQQFLLPVHLPLLAAYFIAVQGMLNPDAAIVQWASWIPFTSPVVMISRITSGIPLLTTVFSWLVLCISFGIMIVWSARIYQNGVLNSGKKTRWLDLWRWTKKHH